MQNIIVEDAILTSLPSAADSSYDLLNLLYASVHIGRNREDFIAALSARLELDISHIHLYHLGEGTLLRYGQRREAPLFEARAGRPPAFRASNAFCYSLPDGELLVQASEDGQVRVIWSQGSILVHLLGQPWRAFVPADLAAQHGELLAYLLPHFASLHSLFTRQQAQLPRINAIRKIHAILPMPLIICRLSDDLLVPNPCALEMLNTGESLGSGKKISSPDALPWKLHRETRTLRLDEAGEQYQLPVFPLHPLAVGSSLHYEVFLLGGGGMGRIGENLLTEIFGFNVGEAQVCACALAGMNPAEMAEELAISINTVKARLKSIYRRLGVSSVAQLAVRLYFHPAYWAAQPRQVPTTSDLW